MVVDAKFVVVVIFSWLALSPPRKGDPGKKMERRQSVRQESCDAEAMTPVFKRPKRRRRKEKEMEPRIPMAAPPP